jgi:hypothetical protein
MTATAINLARDLRAALSTGSVILTKFRKMDDTITERYITRNQDHIPVADRPKYVKAENPHYIVAWDIEKRGWIRFHESRIMEWIP